MPPAEVQTPLQAAPVRVCVGPGGPGRRPVSVTLVRGAGDSHCSALSLSLQSSACLEKRFCSTPFLASEAPKGVINREPPRGFDRPQLELQGLGGLCSPGCGLALRVGPGGGGWASPSARARWGLETRVSLVKSSRQEAGLETDMPIPGGRVQGGLLGGGGMAVWPPGLGTGTRHWARPG